MSGHSTCTVGMESEYRPLVFFMNQTHMYFGDILQKIFKCGRQLAEILEKEYESATSDTASMAQRGRAFHVNNT
jgi:hypothetical protein